MELSGWDGVPVGLGAVGDVVVLVEPVGPAPSAEALDALFTMLRERGFVRAAVRVSAQGVEATLRAAVAGGVGVEAWLESGGGAGEGGALVCCRRHAHLALAVVVERGKRFAATAVGRVVEGGVRVWVDGLPQQAHPNARAER